MSGPLSMDRTATNHYALMRLPEDATYPAIRARFRALMKLVHPDKIDQTNPAAVKQANDDGQRLNNAYEDLGDDRKRRRYDQKLQDDRAKAEQAAKEAAERERLAAEREKDKKDQRAKEEADRKRKAEAEACADRKRQAKALAKHTFSVYRGDSFLASGGSLSTAHWIASGSVKLVGTSMLSIADIEASLFRILRETYAIDVRSGTRDLTALLFASVVTGRSTYSAPYTAQRMAAIGDVFYIDVQRLLGEFFTTALSKTNATPVLVIFDKVVSAAAPPSRASSDATNGHSTSSSAHATAAGPPPPAPPLSRSITLVFGGRRDCNVFYVGLKTTSSRTSTTSISEYQPAIDVGAGDFYMSDVRRLAASAAASLDKLYSAATHELYRVTGEVVDLNSKTKAKTPFNCRRCVACGSDNDVVPLGEWTYAVIARNIPDQGVSCRGGSVSTPGTLLEEIVRGMTTAVLLGLRQNKVPWWFAQFGLKNTAAPFAGQSLTAFFRTVAQAQPAGCTKDTLESAVATWPRGMLPENILYRGTDGGPAASPSAGMASASGQPSTPAPAPAPGRSYPAFWVALKAHQNVFRPPHIVVALAGHQGDGEQAIEVPMTSFIDLALDASLRARDGCAVQLQCTLPALNVVRGDWVPFVRVSSDQAHILFYAGTEFAKAAFSRFELQYPDEATPDQSVGATPPTPPHGATSQGDDGDDAAGDAEKEGGCG